MAKNLLFFTHFHCWPCDGGRQRATFEILLSLIESGRFDITVVMLGVGKTEQRQKLESLGVRYVELKHIGMNHPINILQRLANKLSMDILTGIFISWYYRQKMISLIRESDVFVINGTQWFPLIPTHLRKNAMMVTYDLFYQRKTSHLTTEVGHLSWWQRLGLGIERRLEVAALRTYGVSVVLAEYEDRMLREAGMESEKILRIGMPIRVQAVQRQDEMKPKYDFVFLGTAVDANIEGVDVFFNRLLPLLDGREISIAVAGSLGKDGVWDKYAKRPNLRIDRLGFVDDLGALMAESCIGVASVPWGSGIKVKVVEMAMHHKPLIVTDCAMEGIPLQGDGFINMDKASDGVLKEKILSWLDNPSLASKQGYETGQRVAAAFSADKLLGPLVRWLEKRGAQ